MGACLTAAAQRISVRLAAPGECIKYRVRRALRLRQFCAMGLCRGVQAAHAAGAKCMCMRKRRATAPSVGGDQLKLSQAV